MVRISVAQVEGRTLEQAPESLEACRGLVAEAAAGGADVVVLPEGCYPAYVLGSAEAGRAALAAGPDPEEAFGALAGQHRVTLVAGLVLDSPRGLLNAAVTFGPDGAVLARTAKRFLWHFDRAWFVAGEESPVVDVRFGRVGALVCADARQPAIARGMAGAGAGLICDPTAWVTSTPGAPHNIQPDFLIQARCIENGIVIACASKAGFEGPTVAYSGRSMIVGPDGDVLAEAPERDDVVVSADVSLDGLPRPAVPPKPEWPEGLATEWKPQAPSALSLRVAAANHVPDADVIQRLVVEGVALLVHPDGVEQLADTPVRATRLSPDDLMAPEPARIAALRGAELLIAPLGKIEIPLPILRARAAENRVFLASAGTPTTVVAPTGSVLADAPAGHPFIASTSCHLAEAAIKEMAPATAVLAGE